ncbi:MAG TPA: glycosyltransferase family 4 protein, partial [Acidimicrobiales bacterium]|nr:glycosyltransferase family 4 protein [Acidimicrobiales bacterium]
MSRELARRGHSVEILFVEDKGLADEYGRFCERAIRVPRVDFDPDPIRHPRQQLRRTIVVWEGLRSRPDLIYAQRDTSASWAVPLKQITRKPLVMHFRGFADELTPRQLAKRVKVYNDVADRLIAVSAFVGNQWTSAGLDPKKVQVIHNGIDPDEYPFGDAVARSRARAVLGLDDSLFVVTFAGRVDVEKGVEVLLQAWKELGVGPHEGCLLLVGSPITHDRPDWYLSELQRGVDASVRFIPMQRDVITPLHAADVAVVPSRFEPFGRSVIEGLATGRPVVAS